MRLMSDRRQKNQLMLAFAGEYIRDDFTLAEFGDRNGHRLIQRFRLDLDGMVQTLLVEIRDAAARDTHGVIIACVFAFCSLSGGVLSRLLRSTLSSGLLNKSRHIVK